ncbi:LPXTG cell wall anchor domain-containing protein [Actinoplanes bogorensis]|uniref:LPXTG cell wall anchor domain-containing protein n=1 Tax=Paractinoplanes bogorensis TaxID=1610840 RepID=A0ABS5Z7C0_9ACTN|nr:LPXTG cell wall anchor domain-containing protein [Actinoplanes bogorensis]MBU2670380.1 LPXTG cell wall anchor domain-containing protein [Actinoplanes bogorensis]
MPDVRRRVIVVLALTAGLLGLSAAPALAAADFAASFNAAPELVAAGYTGTYEFQGRAVGAPVDNSAVRVEFALPEGVTFVSAGTNDAGPCEAAGPTVNCSVDLPDTFTNWTYRVTVRFADDLAPGTRLPFRLTVGGAPASFTSTVVTPADLAVTAITPDEPIVPEEPLIFTLIVRNNGPAAVPAFGVSTKFVGIQYLGTKVEADRARCSEQIESVYCRVDHSLAAGAEYRLAFTVPAWPNDTRFGLPTWVEATLADYPDQTKVDATNDKVRFDVDFLRPSASPSTATPPPAAGGSLPITGSSTLPVAAAGLALLLAGAGALITGRRRARP